MCTLTWWQDGPRYALFFNRDELKTRLPAAPPEIRASPNGTRFIAPIDGNRGGTWMIANERGLSIALLNYYDAETDHDPSSKAESRGHLVLNLAGETGTDSVASALAKMPLDGYPPFHLFALAPGEPPRLWTWPGRGTELRTNPTPKPPITTSSYETTSVCARRRKRFREATAHGTTPAILEKLHLSTEPENGGYSIRMRRPRAQTISLNRIDSGDDEIRFTYRPETLDSLDLNEAVTVTLPIVL